jgi:hypothetical protein
LIAAAVFVGVVAVPNDAGAQAGPAEVGTKGTEAFSGVIGRSRVAVAIEPCYGDDQVSNEGVVCGAYFYGTNTEAMFLDGVVKGSKLRLTETPGHGEVTGKWDVVWRRKEGVLKGTWTSKDGKKKLPVSLTRLDAEGAAQVARRRGAFATAFNGQAKAAEPWREPGDVVSLSFRTADGKRAVPNGNGEATFSYPLLVGFPDKAIEAKVNSELKREFEALDEACDGVANRTGRVIFADRDVVTIHSGSEWACGAYPSGTGSSIVVDLRDGKLWRGKEILGVAGLSEAEVKRRVFRDFPGHKSDACPEATPQSYLPTSKGILVADFDYPHVALVCDFQYLLPYESLPEKAKSSPLLARLMARARK